MLFFSNDFVINYLPVVLILFYFLVSFSNKRIILFFLIVCSFYFYASHKFIYLYLIVFSILFNFFLSKLLIKVTPNKKFLLFFGVSINLILLAYFKYYNFFIENLNYFFYLSLVYKNIELPLAISFFTFQQISFLIDTFNKKINSSDLLKYFFYIVFFPQLIAGPIVRYSEISNQLHFKKKNKIFIKNICIGFSLFLIGLFKKLVIADNLGILTDELFNYHKNNTSNIFYSSLSAITFTLQIYYDFSGYSDMAIGLARLFGIKLPYNFDSPLKAKSINEFWNKWHITLSNFIRDYLFYSLINYFQKLNLFFLNKLNYVIQLNINLTICLIVTFTLSGLWHGSSWNFVIWGLSHGIMLAFYHVFLKNIKTNFPNYLCILLNFSFICFAFIPFRAENFITTLNIWRGFLIINNTDKNFLEFIKTLNINYFLIIVSLILIFCFKNTNTFFINKKNKIFNFNIESALLLFIILLCVIFLSPDTSQHFIYFQF